MINITLPDGKQLQFDNPPSVLDVANAIGPGLAKATLAAVVDGKTVDTSYIIKNDTPIKILTVRDEEGLNILRHSAAHLLAHAVKEIFPKIKIAIGPSIANGFYYDFDIDTPFSIEDLAKIETKMTQLANESLPIVRKVITRSEAIKLFEKLNENYKLELIKDIPDDQDIAIYEQGGFVDLCCGPHVPNTSFIKHFKLMKVAGAYWRGDSKNKMLQRIYGTIWGDKKELKKYLFKLEEAEKRDHRKIGKAQDLFHFQEEAPGMAFWHPKGWTIYQKLISYMRDKLLDNGYGEIFTPQIMDRSLWETSGHWDKFANNMFITNLGDRTFCVKPMNCPGHIQIYKQHLKSYRDLPYKIGEFGICHRNEASGAMHGLMRVQQMTQDDAHVFCTPAQITEEVFKLIDLLYNIYKDFGFENIIVRLATRPEQSIGSDEDWTLAEKALEESLNKRKVKWILAPGEGAFYGPKIEFHLQDCLDRIWQCGTIQVDFSMPKRFDIEYVAEDGSRKQPVMIHRAILGSLERFIGVLIEHYAGKLPLWLSPIQVIVMGISQKHDEYVKKITQKLKKIGFLAKFDLRNEKIGFKIREHTLQRIPYMVIVGDGEVANETVSVRTREGKDLGVMPMSALTELLQKAITI